MRPVFDNSWQALLQPGKAEAYFTAAPLPAFRPEGAAFDLGNAWWLAELSRLVYRDDEPGRRSRDEVLRAVALRESWFLSRNATECAIVQPQVGEAFTVLVFRGTSELKDWLVDLDVRPARGPGGGRVHRGFLRALAVVWHPLRQRLQRCHGPLFVTGHSFGAALATLAGAALHPRATYAFGAPRVGNAAFGATLRTPLYRLVNRSDLVTRVPPQGPLLQFAHAGTAYRLGDEGPLAAGAERDEASAGDALVPGDRRWFDPVPFLSDHAPVNYVAALQRLL